MSACLYFFGHLHENLIEDSIKTFPKKNFPLPPNNARGGGQNPIFSPSRKIFSALAPLAPQKNQRPWMHSTLPTYSDIWV